MAYVWIKDEIKFRFTDIDNSDNVINELSLQSNDILYFNQNQLISITNFCKVE